MAKKIISILLSVMMILGTLTVGAAVAEDDIGRIIEAVQAAVQGTEAEAEDTEAPQAFDKVPATHYAYDAVKDLYDRGIVTGDANGDINLDNGITREETVKVALLINGIAVETDLSIDFDDKDDISPWAYDCVATAIKHGVLDGYGDGTIRPLDTVSREEMVAIILRAFNVQFDHAVTSQYTDVASDRWSAGYIQAASDLGLVRGYSDGSFKPDADITRAEAFTICHRELEFKQALASAIQ